MEAGYFWLVTSFCLNFSVKVSTSLFVDKLEAVECSAWCSALGSDKLKGKCETNRGASWSAMPLRIRNLDIAKFKSEIKNMIIAGTLRLPDV